MDKKQIEQKLREEHSKYFRAFREAENLFEDRVDKAGNPYIKHLDSVAMRCNTDIQKGIAYLHDVVEDIEHITEEVLLNKHLIDPYIVECVSILTRKDNQTYSEYIDGIISSYNIDVYTVKLRDLEDNMNLTRFKEPTLKDIKRIKDRYIPAWICINKALALLRLKLQNKGDQ